MCRKYSLTKVCKFSDYCMTCGNCYHFRLKNGSNFQAQYKNVENLRTSQGHIFRILQHLATKFWNFTTFERFLVSEISFFSCGFA